MNKIKDFFKKASLYLDIPLHWSTWTTVFKLTRARPGALLKFIEIDLPTKTLRKNYTPDQLYRYVCLCVGLRRRLGFKDTCLIKSLLQCRLYREAGFDARVHFGTRTADEEERHNLDGWSTVGHCWVTLNNETIPADFPFVFTHP